MSTIKTLSPKALAGLKHRKANFKTTSVTVTKEQYKFIKKHKLNFSLIVQNALNEIMNIGEV